MAKSSPTAYILLPSRKLGGVETWVRDFLQFTSGHYEILPPAKISAIVQPRINEGTICNDNRGRSWQFPSPIFRLLVCLVKLRSSRENFHAHHLQVALLALLLNRTCELTFFSHNNFSRQLAGQNRLKKWLYFRLEEVVLKKAKRVFSFSVEDAERMRKKRTDVSVLEGSFSDHLFPVLQTNDVGKRNGIVWVGRLASVKNPLLAIEAFELFANRNPGELTLVGDGPLRKKVEKRVMSSPSSNRIKILGHQSPYFIKELLTQSRILLVTSASEGPTPRNIYEALACGTAIVTTSAGDPSSIVQKTRAGHVIDPASPANLADGLEASLLDKSNRSFSRYLSHNRGSYFFPELERKLGLT